MLLLEVRIIMLTWKLFCRYLLICHQNRLVLSSYLFQGKQALLPVPNNLILVERNFGKFHEGKIFLIMKRMEGSR